MANTAVEKTQAVAAKASDVANNVAEKTKQVADKVQQ